MRIELNIGLDINDRVSTEAQYASQAAFALHQLKGLAVHSQRYVTQYQGPLGDVTEHGLFVALETNNLLALEARVFHLAVGLGQDCIGVYYPATDSGVLVGPKCEGWGSFHPKFFKRFEVEQEKLAA